MFTATLFVRTKLQTAPTPITPSTGEQTWRIRPCKGMLFHQEKEDSTGATPRADLRSSRPVRNARHKGSHTVRFYLHETSRIGQVESGRGMERGCYGAPGEAFWGLCLELVVIVAQICDYTKTHQIVYFKRVIVMAGEVYLKPKIQWNQPDASSAHRTCPSGALTMEEGAWPARPQAQSPAPPSRPPRALRPQSSGSSIFPVLSGLPPQTLGGWLWGAERSWGTCWDSSGMGLGEQSRVWWDTGCNTGHRQEVTRPGTCYGAEQTWGGAKPDSNPGKD